MDKPIVDNQLNQYTIRFRLGQLFSYLELIYNIPIDFSACMHGRITIYKSFDLKHKQTPGFHIGLYCSIGVSTIFQLDIVLYKPKSMSSIHLVLK
jgi:hypothetical protein